MLIGMCLLFTVICVQFGELTDRDILFEHMTNHSRYQQKIYVSETIFLATSAKANPRHHVRTIYLTDYDTSIQGH